MRLWDPRGGLRLSWQSEKASWSVCGATFQQSLSSRARSFLVERVTGGIAVRVSTIQKAQSKKQQASLWVGCLRAESRKKQGGEANGARSQAGSARRRILNDFTETNRSHRRSKTGGLLQDQICILE